MDYTMQELEELVNRHAPAVYRLAYARTGSREDAEDVMQEVFLRLLRRAPELNGEEHLRAWLLHVAAILGKKEATVSTWLFRARGLLRDMLTEEGTYEF